MGSIDDLPDALLVKVFEHLSSRDLIAASLTHKQWQRVSYADALWRPHLLRHFDHSDSTSPDGAPLPNYHASFLSFMCEYGDLAPSGGRDPAAYYLRARKAFSAIKSWLDPRVPAIAESLQPGAAEAEITVAATRLGTGPWSPAAKAMFRVHDGQKLSYDKRDARPGVLQASIFHGILGGYCFYDTLVSTRLLSVAAAADLTELARARGGFGMAQNERGMVIFAAAHNRSKLFALDVGTGEVSVRNARGGWLPCCPPSEDPAAQDGCLRWIEEYARQLQSGVLRVAPLVPDQPNISALSESISLYPAAGPRLSCAITRGVRIEAAVLFVPELSDGNRGDHYSYCIRFSLLSEAEQIAAGAQRALAEVQLRGRHWVITDATGAVEEVAGEGVIGQFPILRQGQPPIFYSSCTHMAPTPGRMEGSFAFVEGTIERPAGPDFEAVCAPFPLSRPEFIF